VKTLHPKNKAAFAFHAKGAKKGKKMRRPSACVIFLPKTPLHPMAKIICVKS
jgi:hypothetical protein